MLFLFLIDTSASMNQHTACGLSLLDVAKSAVEYFFKKRACDQAVRSDTYFLVTCEEDLNAIKVGWKDSLSANAFLQEVKNLEAYDLSDIRSALKKSFDLLNMYHLSNNSFNNKDHYAQGRYPWEIEPTAIIVLSDSGAFCDKNGTYEELELDTSHIESELWLEPFRWEQHVYGISVRFPGVECVPSNGGATRGSRESSTSTISSICEMTGGSYTQVANMKQLYLATDSILAKCASNASFGVSVSFEPIVQHQDSSTCPPPTVRGRSIYVRPGSPGNWPLPEDYSVTANMTKTPPRHVHPCIQYRSTPVNQTVHPKDFPVDVYVLESSPLTEWILSRTLNWNMVYECSIVPNNDLVCSSLHVPPFGYLKPYSDQNIVCLHVLAYNYPMLLSLFNHAHQSDTSRWKAEFERYINSTPPYYIPFIRSALRRLEMGGTRSSISASSLISDKLVASCELPYTILEWINGVRKLAFNETSLFESALASQRKKASNRARQSEQYETKFNLNNLNVFELSRSQLFESLDQMRTNLFSSAHADTLLKKRTLDDEAKHRVPIGEMGDYQSHLMKKKPGLRTVEDKDMGPMHSRMTPLKKNNQKIDFVDEADMPWKSETSSTTNAGMETRSRKLKLEYIRRRQQEDLLRSKNPTDSQPMASNEEVAFENEITTIGLRETDLSTPSQSSDEGVASSKVQKNSQPLADHDDQIGVRDSLEPKPSALNVQRVPPSLTPAENRLEMLKMHRHNNALKLDALKAIRRPVQVDLIGLRKCIESIQGGEVQRKMFIYSLSVFGQRYKRDVIGLLKTSQKSR
ncbi:integrator complex subunit 6-like [Schistocerca gregaria]|uniref:integrator complex subunit 6-like n=1 Tax=Schistocerca gregaria TaxID=7010 RepID=UPI00211DB7AA|nr:integrator complex subunit 6-like [Schistocerca gregaria]